MAAVLQALQRQGEALQHLLNQQQNNAANTGRAADQLHTSTVSQNITFDKFDPKEEEFSEYLERFENYVRLRGLTLPEDATEENTRKVNEDKRNILLVCLQRLEFAELKADSPDHKPTNLSYDDLISKLKKRYDKTTNVQTERHKFLSRVQNKAEALADYISALKQIAQRCSWTCPNDNCGREYTAVFQAQFIRGIRESFIREKLLQLEAGTDLAKTLEVAQSLEAAHKQSTEEFSSEKSNTAVVNKISRDEKTRERNEKFQYRGRSRSRGKFQQKHTTNQSGQNQRKFHPPSRELLKRLGLADLCLSCGKNNHTSDRCYVRDKLQCTSCGGSKHVAKVCIKTKKAALETVKTLEFEYATNAVDTVINVTVFDITGSGDENLAKKILVNLKLNDSIQTFELDTGSPVTIVSRKDFNKLNLRLVLHACPNIRFRVYNQNLVSPEGFVIVRAQYKGTECMLPLFIVTENLAPIVGRIWIRKLKIINLDEIGNESATRTADLNQVSKIDISKILKSYSDIFQDDKVGKIPDVKIKLKLKDDAKPVFLPPRSVPYALRPLVEEKLKWYEKWGAIEKVEYSQWGSPLVISPKANGEIRICADYSKTVNPALVPAHHPIPRADELFNQMHGSSYFCIIDANQAYLHTELDHESSLIATISTHLGTYKVNRMWYGLSIGPSVFHSVFQPILSGLKGVAQFFDDLAVHGATLEECYENLIALLERLRKFNIFLNRKKCKFFVRELEYLGHIISERGLQKNPKKVRAIQEAPVPKNESELRAFLGLVNFYAKFTKNSSSILEPLNRLTGKVPFVWTKECNTAFRVIKDELSKEHVLATYVPGAPLTLETDASPVGLGAILSQKINGEMRPIEFISRSLTAAEKNYSQLDREGLAVYWATTRLFQYLYGAKFEIVTDNKPLQAIFNPDKSLPAVTATRLTRMAHWLQQFNFTVVHRPGKDNTCADYLSRAPLPLQKDEILEDETYRMEMETINLITSDETVTVPALQKAIAADKELAELREKLRKTSSTSEFSLHDNVILRNGRVYIPESLQQYVLKELHSTHYGASKMKTLARQTVYWRNIDRDIESMVKCCPECAMGQKDPEPAPVHPWERPTEPWSRIHIDFAEAYGKHFLIIVDAFSKWIDIIHFPVAPTSRTSLQALRRVLAHQGLPHILVSDNAPIFKSGEFEGFLQRQGIHHRTSSPNKPSSNGQAERLVGVFKAKLYAMCAKNPTNINEKVEEIIFQYLATPLASGKSPAELHYNRKLRTKLHLLIPPRFEKVPPNQATLRTFRKGDRVLARNYRGSLRWKLGVISEVLGSRTYLVKLDGGYNIKRHVDQLRSTECGKEAVEPENTPIQPSALMGREKSTGQKKVTFASTSTTLSVPPEIFPGPTQQPKSLPSPTATTGATNPGPPATNPPETVRRSERARKAPLRLNL